MESSFKKGLADKYKNRFCQTIETATCYYSLKRILGYEIYLCFTVRRKRFAKLPTVFFVSSISNASKNYKSKLMSLRLF